MVGKLGEWRYSLRWCLPHLPSPRGKILMSEVVPAGDPTPASIMDLFVPSSGYAVCIDFLDIRPIKRWTPERKAQARQRNMRRRIMNAAPLLADELIARELAARPEYFNGQ
ncbi:TPA: theronine dehydrogenase [Yersinia enterocolitica]|uniref:hypothetical protein n=1 Tax=Yersinia massiliensis TaxID=419257 RepID=UPI0005B4279D|nr:hypothetical protein [Yersinia massiliensis]QKJ09316.1 theronine dehydrogenase [Yersinia massiliensis]